MNSSWKARASALLAWTLVLATILPLTAAPVMAQATTGVLRGTVTDANGAAVSGATVTLKSEGAGGVSAPFTTNEEGTFDAAGLPPGNYTVTVEAAGFKRSVATDVIVKIGIVNPVAVVLEAGNVAETVTVTAGTEEVVQRDQAQISTTIETRRIEDLPSNGAGGGIDTLALLAPGVINNRSGGTNTNGTGLSVNGNRGRSNNFQIDGADNNDLTVGGPALFVDFQDSIQEYQVVTNNFSAQYGRNQGAIVNIVTKSGTNTYHGTAFLFHQDRKNLNSLNNIEKRSGKLQPDPSLYNVYGGTFGGPLHLPRFGEGGPSIYSGKDRLFFFGAYQGIRNPNVTTGSSTALAIVASEFPRLRSTFPGNPVINTIATYSPFAIPGAQVSTFATGTPVTGPVAACGNQTFTTGGAFDAINLGTAASPQCFQAAQYQRTVSTPYVEDYYTIRFDAKPTDRNNINFRYLKQKSANVGGASCCSSGFIGDVPAGSKNIGGGWTRTISNTMVNEFRAATQKIGVEFGGGCDVATPGCVPGPAQIGQALANIGFGGITGVTKTGISLATIGPATNLPQGRIGKVYQAADNLSWSLGKHSLLMGAEYKRLTNLVPFLPTFNGAFGFNTAERLRNNAPSAFTLAVGEPLLSFVENDQYYFFQDDFKVRPNLTLNLGLRYEYTGQPINQLNELTVARESSASTALFNPALPLSIRTTPIIPVDKNNFAPRLGFAYSPRFWKSFLGEDATVIRGGFSIAYDAAFYNILLNVMTAAPVAATLTIPQNNLPTSNSPVPLPNNPTGDVVRSVASSSGVLPRGVLNPLFLGQTNVAPDFRSPYSEQFSLGIQHQFGRRHVAEVRYVGTHGVGLFQNINGNFFIGPLVNGFTVTRNGVTRTFPGFPNLLPQGTTEQVCTDVSTTLDREDACNRRQLRQAGVTTRANTSQSIYHSMQSRYNGRMLNDSLSLGLAYTWSKTIDDSSEIFAQTDISSPNAQNPFCINRCERGPSALDRPHAFSMSFIYDVPFFREQRGLVGHVLGGWQVNSTYIVTSGATFTPSQSGNGTIGLGNTYLTAGDRPFLANANADRRLVGITGIDARLVCNNCIPLTALPSNGSGDLTLYSYNALNAATPTLVPITANDVKYIFNGPGAARLFGTPFGSAGRNIERGPMFNQMNASLFKNIKVYERLTLQLRGEAFNVLNHPTPSVGNTTGGGYLPVIGVNSAGIPGAAFGENQDITFARRVVQVGLRVIF
jgi:outer membrane receptor protein involved in Fe transport